MPEQTIKPPPVGSIARDTRTDRIGKVMPRVMADLVRISSLPILVTLRPIKGGLEWDVPIKNIERLDVVPEQQEAEAAG